VTLKDLIAPALLGLVWATSASAQSSLCTAEETTIFACRTGNKMVSVCASKDAGPAAGSLQYRFGKPGASEPPEMTLPEQRLPPAKAATGDTLMFSGGGGAWLRFTKPPVAYTLYTGIGKWGPNGEVRDKAGIAVERQGKLIANLACSGKVTSELGPDWFGRAGITAGGQEFDLPE
jgi:hypothetical protein